jgi:hypothetical protein
MARGLLIAATIIDVALAALIIAVSGFIVGSGPESMRAGDWGVAALTAAVMACLAAPAIGFAMRASQRPAGGLMVAWLPPIAALIALAMPTPY